MRDERCYRSVFDNDLVHVPAVASFISHLSSLVVIIIVIIHAPRKSSHCRSAGDRFVVQLAAIFCAEQMLGYAVYVSSGDFLVQSRLFVD